ncbi:MAG: hypothetical protein ACP5K1_01345 [Candidatus Bathyarchaeia archaeon]
MAQEDLLDEASRIVGEAERKGVILRVMGAVAFRLHCPKHGSMHEALNRSLTDLDLAAYSRQRSGVEGLFRELGYSMKPTSFAMHMLGDREIFIHPSNRFVVDVFYDKLVMCHDIDFHGRLERDYPTIPLAELLLEKLQIVQLTEKDVKDVLMLIREHEIGGGDRETVNADYIAGILSEDWGFYYTVTSNIRKIRELTVNFRLDENAKIEINSKLDSLLKAIEEKPKSMKWKLRAKVGPKKKWYRDVETIEH